MANYCSTCRFYVKGKCTLLDKWMDKFASCSQYEWEKGK